jgi:hypothetical protein
MEAAGAKGLKNIGRKSQREGCGEDLKVGVSRFKHPLSSAFEKVARIGEIKAYGSEREGDEFLSGRGQLNLKTTTFR